MRTASIFSLIALTTAASGCATSSQGPHSSACYSDSVGNCKPDLVSTAVVLGAMVVAGGIYYLATRPAPRERDAGLQAPARQLVGQVRWRGSTDGAPSVSVTLRAGKGPVVQSVTTDKAGRFQFPLPRKAGWYTVSALADAAAGETTIWLQDAPPDALQVLLQPLSPAPAGLSTQ